MPFLLRPYRFAKRSLENALLSIEAPLAASLNGNPTVPIFQCIPANASLSQFSGPLVKMFLKNAELET